MRYIRILGWLLVLLLLLAVPFTAWSQNVLRRHVGLVNPLDFGTSCTTATLQAAISGAPSGQGVLMLTPVDRNGAACTWTITSNVTVPNNLVLAVPHGAKASVSAGVTLTMVRCPREDNEDWRTGAGTYTVIEDPFPGGGGGGGGGVGDITAVWTCATLDCSALTAASGDTLDAGSASSSSPTTRSTTLPATCTEGQHHQDTDAGGSETYVCTAANTWVKLMGSTDVLTDGQIPDLNALSTGLTPGRCVETAPTGVGFVVAGGACATSGGDVSDVWTCSGANCNALTAGPGDTLDAGGADSSRPTTRSTTLPAACAEGQMHQDTDSGGSELFICTATNTWTKLSTTVGAYAANFTNQTTLNIAGTTHQLGTSDLVISIKDASSPRGVVIPNTITIDDSNFNVVITFVQAQSGRVYIK